MDQIAGEEESVAPESVVVASVVEELEPTLPRAVLSQHDYEPTPYAATSWEIVGERCQVRDFVSMDLEVLKDDRTTPDPMFLNFGGPHSGIDHGTSWRTPGSDVREEVVEEATPEIDWSLIETQLEEKFAEGKEQGYAEGYAAAEVKIIEKYEILSAQMKQVTDGISAAVQEHIGAVEKRAMQLSIEIARKILQTTVETEPDYILAVLRQAMGNLGAAKPLRIKVSHQDYEFLDVVGLPPDLAEGELGVEYVADPSIVSGCVVETDFGELNLELDVLWNEVKQALEKA